jgi:hypothetical protein
MQPSMRMMQHAKRGAAAAQAALTSAVHPHPCPACKEGKCSQALNWVPERCSAVCSCLGAGNTIRPETEAHQPLHSSKRLRKGAAHLEPFAAAAVVAAVSTMAAVVAAVSTMALPAAVVVAVSTVAAGALRQAGKEAVRSGAGMQAGAHAQASRLNRKNVLLLLPLPTSEFSSSGCCWRACKG